MKANIELKTGDILHCKGNSWLSRAIRWWTKSDFSNHTAVLVEVWGQIYVVDAQNNGVNPKPLEAWLREYEYEIIVARPITGPRDVKSFSIRAFLKVGLTGYDFISLIWRHPWALITGKWKGSDPNKDRMVCSEYVAWLYQIEKPYRITPKDLHEITRTRGDFVHSTYDYTLD